MASTRSNNFSIEEAFESDEDDRIRSYGTTTESAPLKPKVRLSVNEDDLAVKIQDPGKNSTVSTSLVTKATYNTEDGCQDRESLIQGDEDQSSNYSQNNKSWLCHPKVKENWKTVAASFTLLLIGIGLIVTGIVVEAIPLEGVQSFVFFIAGVICFIPGAYHLVYIYFAIKGRRGFGFHNLPLFK